MNDHIVNLFKLYKHTLFCIDVLGQDVNNVSYVVSGNKIKANQLIEMFK